MAIFLTVAITELHAQVKSEYVFGMNISTMTVKTMGISAVAESPVSFHFGKYFEIPVAGNFSLQPSLLFSAKGADYKIDTLDVSISPIYFEVPVNALYKFGSRTVKVSIFAGPYLALGVGGYKIESGSELKYINYGTGKNHDLKRFDFGINLGTSLSIRDLIISFQYGIGLTNISPTTAFNSEMKNQVIGISISAGENGLSRKFGR